ncbi:MAG: I78 family peptidase inhibitor [Pseudomonadota bacterium]
MTKLTTAFAAATLLALAACGSNAEETTANEADDFAARINSGGNEPLPEATVSPSVAPPRPNAAQGPYRPGTATDPESAICGANEMGPFLGQEATDDVKLEIINVIDGANEVRFVMPSGVNVTPDPTNPRLSIMLDAQGIIRDARCG